MTWQPKLSGVPIKKGSNKLLWEAFEKTQPNKFEYRLKDEGGTFALDTEKGLIVAKKKTYGNIISAHQRVIFSAMNQSKKLIMYIKANEALYVYDPVKIWGNNERNMRGDAVMLNWHIRKNGYLKNGEPERLVTL